jgi:hypothetical protein
MSVWLIRAVFESALPVWLKPYAAAYASFAEDDGSSVYPSIAHVARKMRRSPRQVRRATSVLRSHYKILKSVETSRRHSSTTYVFQSEKLPHASDGLQLRFPQVK